MSVQMTDAGKCRLQEEDDTATALIADEAEPREDGAEAPAVANGDRCGARLHLSLRTSMLRMWHAAS